MQPSRRVKSSSSVDFPRGRCAGRKVAVGWTAQGSASSCGTAGSRIASEASWWREVVERCA